MADLNVLYPNVTDCFALEKQINIIKNDAAHYFSILNDGEGKRRQDFAKFKTQQFNLMGCPAKIEAKRNADTMAIFDKNASESESRIVSNSIKTRNVLIAISAVTILISFILIKKSHE